MSWVSPVEKVIGIIVFLFTEHGEDPSNSCSRIGFGKFVRESLFRIANNSSTKQWEDPESNNATNGRACLATAAEVRERRKESRDSEDELSRSDGAMLPFFLGQPVKRAELERLPRSFLTPLHLATLVLLL